MFFAFLLTSVVFSYMVFIIELFFLQYPTHAHSHTYIYIYIYTQTIQSDVINVIYNCDIEISQFFFFQIISKISLFLLLPHYVSMKSLLCKSMQTKYYTKILCFNELVNKNG